MKRVDDFRLRFGKQELVPIMIGGQAEDERLRVMNQFQQGIHRATVSTYGAGSESINLQDEYGLGAREGILFPCFRAQFLVQAMNRYNRATSKTPSITRFLYAYGTAEVTTMMRLRSKKSLMDTLNDGESIPLPSAVDGGI